MKKCVHCKATKSLDEFKVIHKGRYRRGRCYDCYNAQDIVSARKRKYGLTNEQYEAMFKKQNGCCAVCKEIFLDTPCVDHDHQTGIVRGLLHRECNVLLGAARDSIDRLYLAADYLDLHREKTNG